MGKIQNLKKQVNGLIAQKKEKIRGKIVTTKKKPMYLKKFIKIGKITSLNFKEFSEGSTLSKLRKITM